MTRIAAANDTQNDDKNIDNSHCISGSLLQIILQLVRYMYVQLYNNDDMSYNKVWCRNHHDEPDQIWFALPCPFLPRAVKGACDCKLFLQDKDWTKIKRAYNLLLQSAKLPVPTDSNGSIVSVTYDFCKNLFVCVRLVAPATFNNWGCGVRGW